MDFRGLVCLGMFVVVGILNTGCAHALARQMVAPPNNRFFSHRDGAPTQASGAKGERRFMVAVGPPGAMLACWVAEPKGLPVRGTVLVLHGFLSDHNLVRGAAEALTKAGYRTVLVDLRGHGDSTGDHVTFGVVEARDMVQLTDYLQANNLAGEHIGVYGTSLGAAVAIQFAGIDPRVSSVVAVAPFASLKDEAPHFARTMLPVPALFMSDEELARLVHDAGEIAKFDPEKASPLDAITRTKANILLIHGEWDNIIPADQSRKLAAAAPDHAKLVILQASGHLAACLGLGGDVEKLSRAFFDENLKDEGKVEAEKVTPAGTGPRPGQGVPR